MESSAEKEEEQKQPIGCVIYFASLLLLCSSFPLFFYRNRVGCQPFSCVYPLLFVLAGVWVFCHHYFSADLFIVSMFVHMHTHTHTRAKKCVLQLCVSPRYQDEIFSKGSCMMKREGCCCCGCRCCFSGCCRRHLFYFLLTLRDKMHPHGGNKPERDGK